MLAKAKLVSAIHRVVEDGKLASAQVAALVDLEEARLSEILRGRFRDVPIDRLIEMLNALGQNVEISIRPKPSDAEKARTTVSIAHVL